MNADINVKIQIFEIERVSCFFVIIRSSSVVYPLIKEITTATTYIAKQAIADGWRITSIYDFRIIALSFITGCL